MARRRLRATRGSLAGAACLLLLACGEAPRPEPVAAGANVILVSLDTVRADHLGCYGDGDDLSPRLDALADESFVFERAFTHSPNTLVAHASLLTSLHPVAHGARPERPLGDAAVTLAEVLAAAGYETAGFVTHGDYLSAEKGFAQGFDHFDAAYGDADALHARLQAWLPGRDRSRPLFLFLHYYDAHSDWERRPYDPPAPFRTGIPDAVDGFDGCRGNLCASRLLLAVKRGEATLSEVELDWTRRLYAAGIRYLDDRIGALLETLGREGLREASWIAITADHGEEFLEHGKMLHGQAYDHTARVPLLIRAPTSLGLSPARIPLPVAHVDVMPTLLAGVGVPAPAGVQGRSLLPLLTGGTVEARPVFFNHFGKPSRVSVRAQGFVLVNQTGEPALFEDASDPHQQQDRAGEHPERVARLTETARRFHAVQKEAARALAAGEVLAPDAAEQERLRQLGYLP